MATELWVKSLSTITAQERNGTDAFAADEYPTDGTWNTADAYYGGTPTVISQASGGNAAGAEYVNLMVFVDDAPSADAEMEIWYSESENNSDYTYWRYSHTVGENILDTDDLYYDAGLFVLTAKYTKLAIVARSYDIDDATLYATPKLYESQ